MMMAWRHILRHTASVGITIQYAILYSGRLILLSFLIHHVSRVWIQHPYILFRSGSLSRWSGGARAKEKQTFQVEQNAAAPFNRG